MFKEPNLLLSSLYFNHMLVKCSVLVPFTLKSVADPDGSQSDLREKNRFRIRIRSSRKNWIQIRPQRKTRSGSDLQEKPGSRSDLREKPDPDPTFEKTPSPKTDPTIEIQPRSASGSYLILTE